MADASGWFALVGALGGVAITGVIGISTSVLNHRAERYRQLRQERRETYAQYWIAWNSLIRALEAHASGPETGREPVRAAEAEWRQTIDPMFIICGRQVLEAGIAHVNVTEARITAALRGTLLDGAGKSRALSRAMRTDLDV